MGAVVKISIVGAGVDADGAGVGAGVGPNVGPGVSSGVGPGIGLGVGAGVDAGVGAGVGAGVSLGICAGVGAGFGDYEVPVIIIHKRKVFSPLDLFLKNLLRPPWFAEIIKYHDWL